MDCDLNDKRYSCRYLKKINQAKSKVRPGLSKQEDGWQKDKYVTEFDLSLANIQENIIRIDRNIVSTEEFREQYEKNNTPVIIYNDQKNWNAHQKWLLSRLKLKYRNQLFRCGDDNKGCSVKMKMKYYIDYMHTNTDDSPLYIFDGNIDENDKKKRLLEDFVISDYFFEDLFSIVGDKKRPPHRWFVMGPARSGSGIHIDPLGTSAWNALVKGYKRWCMFPPCTPRFLVKPVVDYKWKNINEAISWFDLLHKRVMAPDWPEQYAVIEGVQRPGETIFVPSGWWHVVLNLTDTVAITQNFCSTVNFPIVWRKTYNERCKFAKFWYEELMEIRPDLCEIADGINIKERLGKYRLSMSSSSSSSVSSSSSSASSSESAMSSRSNSRSQSVASKKSLSVNDDTHRTSFIKQSKSGVEDGETDDDDANNKDMRNNDQLTETEKESNFGEKEDVDECAVKIEYSTKLEMFAEETSGDNNVQ